jgi:hypothetical protein
MNDPKYILLQQVDVTRRILGLAWLSNGNGLVVQADKASNLDDLFVYNIVSKQSRKVPVSSDGNRGPICFVVPNSSKNSCYLGYDER